VTREFSGVGLVTREVGHYWSACLILVGFAILAREDAG